MFIGFDRIHERDGRMDRHRKTASAALMHSIERQKLVGNRMRGFDWYQVEDLERP